MDNILIGNYIQSLRKKSGLTQKELADKLNISFQAVSKWENGEALPDVMLLLDLANILGTTVANILSGENIVRKNLKQIRIADVVAGFEAMNKMKACFGANSYFYKGMIEGINSKMNMNIEEYLNNPQYIEMLYAEVILQAIEFDNAYVDMQEVEAFFNNKKMVKYIKEKITTGSINIEKQFLRPRSDMNPKSWTREIQKD